MRASPGSVCWIRWSCLAGLAWFAGLAGLLGLGALAGCGAAARPVSARYPQAQPGDDAELTLQFTHAVDGAHLSINGHPVVMDAHTARIVVAGLPAGELAVMLAADGLEKAFTLELQPGQHVMVPVAAAPAREGPSPSVQALRGVTADLLVRAIG
ncbi:MAG: hypothetical protein IT370_34460, partial [Deltaproteobacteria bacterium]|nr:hypothetical protein [Deltaproteobacteria bacterium]